MYKTIIHAPKGVKYLSDLQIKNGNGEMVKFELPNGILNKVVTGCGGTTLALEDQHKTIICSPRVELLKNKHAQYPEQTLLLIGDTSKRQINDYLQSHAIPKILVTYDSLYKLDEYITDKSDWRVIVDEFQCILSDASIKSETEMRLLEQAKSYPYVTYMSATPIIEEFLSEIPELNSLPYFIIDWEDQEKVYVDRQKHASPLNAALGIVRNYKNGNYPYRFDANGNKLYSRECVIFLNSVRTIFSIIRQAELAPEDVNIIMGQTEDNDKALAKACPGFTRGHVPMKGESHKLITFCTSTAYAGCDFYSTSASTFVICDCERPNTSVDISTELVQIAGRQRLAENPFRRYITVVFNTNSQIPTNEEFTAKINQKVKLSKSEIEWLNSQDAASIEWKRKEITVRQRSLNFSTSYVYWNDSDQKFEFNRLANVNDRYLYKVQCHNYANGIMVRKLMEETGQFDVSEKQEYYSHYHEQLKLCLFSENFASSMKQYCEFRKKAEAAEGMLVSFEMSALENRFPSMKYYYEQLGAERIKALGYKECELKNAVKLEASILSIRHKLEATIKPNIPYKAESISAIMAECYAAVGVEKTPKVADLEKLYGFKVRRSKITRNDGFRESIYYICTL